MSTSERLERLIDYSLLSLVATYKALHAAPELSHREEQTSAFIAAQMRSLGYAVTENIGRYLRPEWRGYGVVALLENGTGPTVLVRTDMDALPVEEKTGLPYASRVTAKTDAGQDVGVMHACGHDLHMACFLGTARALVELRDCWRGTALLIGQPAEETVDGAQAMLADGLYERFPVPDYALALHDNARLEAGKVGITNGYFLASVNSVDVTIRGVGGHGSAPEQAKDAIVLAAQVIIALQTIVSREVSPLQPAVVSIGSVHGGTRYNILPDEVHLQLTVRAYSEDVRHQILEAIERICRGTALAAGVPDDRLPVVSVSETETSPATYNEPHLTGRLADVFVESLGADNVLELAPLMGSEDFGRFGLEGHRIPTCMFWLGAVAPEKMDEHRREGTPLPPLHSAHFAPLPEPTIRTGVKAMTQAVLELMKRG
jgi:hippurate hydrolase